MKILGIHDGHCATASLLVDGKVVSAISEERLSRRKNQAGLPLTAVKRIFEIHNISGVDIDLAVFSSKHFLFQGNNPNPMIRRKESIFTKSIINLSRKVYDFSYRINYRIKILEAIFIFMRKPFYELLFGKLANRERFKIVSELLNIPLNKIVVCDHHLAHVMAALYSLPCIKDLQSLIFCADGMGDNMCASLYVHQKRKIKRVSVTKIYRSLAWFYGMVTVHLGMKFLEDEYKVMGLASYADSRSVDRLYSKFKELLWINNKLEFESKFSTRLMHIHLEKILYRKRFDYIAGAAQKLVEDLSSEWVKKGIEKYKIRNIVLTGGLFMNIKANKHISENRDIEKFYVCPSAGDESTAIGAAIWGYVMVKEKNDMQGFSNVYIGHDYTNNEVLESLKTLDKEKYEYEYFQNIERKTAELLKEGRIVARFKGKMEFGARALGNRSILANPKNYEVVSVINHQIKNRDFWMPFSPTIIFERRHDYMLNSKNIESPYMTIGFESTNLAKEELKACLHPFDKTMRPQILKKEDNPSYYRLIKEFEKLTGIGGILNTSFNLHGEPIVESPQDALKTMEESGLEYLTIENYLVKKKCKSAEKKC